MQNQITFFPYKLGYKSCYHANIKFRIKRLTDSIKYHIFWISKLLLGDLWKKKYSNTKIFLAKEISILEYYLNMPLAVRLYVIILSCPILLAYENIMNQSNYFVKRSLKSILTVIQNYSDQKYTVVASNDILFWDRLILCALYSKGYSSRGYFHGFPPVAAGISQELFSEIIVPSSEFASCIGASNFIERSPDLTWLNDWTIDTSCNRLVICTFPEPIRLVKGSHFDTNRKTPTPLVYIKRIAKALNTSELYLRVHPSESEEYYTRNLKDIKLSFTRHILPGDCFIGPTSTFFFDAIKEGYPYLIYEPLVKGNRLNGTRLYSGYYNSPLGNYIFTDSSSLPSASELPTLFCKKYVRSLFEFYAPH